MSRNIWLLSKHQEMSKAVSSIETLKAFFRPSPIEEAITQAEVLFANFVAEHNLSFMVADHFTHLTSVMFPDSKIAEAFGSARTQTTCIIKGALHPHYSEPVIKMCRENPFSILCDKGNDAYHKNFTMLVRL